MKHLALALCILSSCTQLPTTPDAPKEPITSAPKQPWNNEKWDAFLSDALKTHGKALVQSKPADRAQWCPTYDKLTEAQQAAFYGVLIGEASRWESKFKPETNTYECRKTCVYSGGCRYVEGRGYCMLGGHKLDGGLVISRGLMQMSLESAQGIGCDVAKPSDLNDPEKNLTCAVKAFAYYITRGGQIATKVDGKWRGAAAYFAVFRGTDDYTAKSRAAIMAAGKGFCK